MNTDETQAGIVLSRGFNIRFCNAYHYLKDHEQACEQCAIYLRHGDEDLCDKGKEIIANELAFSDTSIEFNEEPQIPL